MTIDLRFAVTDSAQLERIIGMPPFVCDNDYGILRHLQAIELDAVLRQDPFWQDVAHTHLAQLIFEILRQQHKRENGHRPELQSALGIIHQSLPAGIDLEQLAHRVHLSSSHLITLFKTHLGKTPQRVQTELKIEHIKHELLTSPDTSITVIVRQYGWRDQRAFRRQFREYVGMTPTEFRERYPHHQETEQTSESWVVFSRSIPMAWKSVTRV